MMVMSLPTRSFSLGAEAAAQSAASPNLRQGEEIRPQNTGPAWVGPVVLLGIFGLVGTLIYLKYKTTKAIIEKEGVGKALAFEAGTTGLSILERQLARPNSKAKRNGRTRRRG